MNEASPESGQEEGSGAGETKTRRGTTDRVRGTEEEGRQGQGRAEETNRGEIRMRGPRCPDTLKAKGKKHRRDNRGGREQHRRTSERTTRPKRSSATGCRRSTRERKPTWKMRSNEEEFQRKSTERTRRQERTERERE